MRVTVAQVTRAGLIAAVYAAVTIAFRPISYGPFFQIRVSEALTVLPFLTPVAIPGLFLGVFIANIFGGLGIYDIVFGSLATLIAALLTWRMPWAVLAPLPPVLVNAFVVGWYLAIIAGAPARVTMSWVALGQVIACYLLGYPLLLYVQRNEGLRRLLKGE